MNKKAITGVLTLFLLSALMIAVPVIGHSGVSLSAGTFEFVNIDGIIDADEWATADSEPFTISRPYSTEEYPGTLYVMNDGDNLYLAVAIEDPTPNDRDMVWFLFDNNHDGHILFTDEDDCLRLWMNYLGFEDLFLDHDDPQGINLDTAEGGTIDGSGATSRSDGINYFELSHPLDSGDAQDFSLSWEDTVGFALCYIDNQWYKGMWPFAPGQAMYWHDIVILPSADDPDAYVEYVDQAIQDLPDELFTLTEGNDIRNVKKYYSEKFREVLFEINRKNDYEQAINKLEEIRTNMYNDIVDSEERDVLISQIDYFIAYLETL